MKDDASVEAPPFSLVENPESLLDRTDLLFIDPVATGYSRAAEGVDPKTFHGVEEDIESVGRFIHLYVTRNKRWNSPRFLIGESYGTTRAAGLAAHLQDAYGMELNGVLLVSSILDFSTVSLGDLPSVLFLPTFTATAWYHKRLSPDRQKDLRKTLQESEEFAIGEYATALLRGNSLPDDGRKKIAERLSALTGLSAEYVERSNLRISQSRFCKELLRTDRLTVGRLDARYAGRDKDAAGERYEYDPSYSAIQGPYTECLYSYVRRDLQFESDQVYEILTGKVQPWNYGKDAARASLNVAPRLRQAMTRNPHLKVLIANGYYDLATPYFATQYTVNHLDLEPPLRGNIRMTYYESGHMMYIHGPSLAQQRKDLDQFLDWALKP
jgi:carboxypeptidase C (cathepsin A)